MLLIYIKFPRNTISTWTDGRRCFALFRKSTMQLFLCIWDATPVLLDPSARAASADTVILGSKHLMVPLGLLMCCAKFLHIQIYKLYALVFLLFLLVTGNSIHYSEIVCLDCYEFSPFVPSRSLFCTLLSAPESIDFHTWHQPASLPSGFHLCSSKGSYHSSSWSFRPRGETRPPVLLISCWFP